MKMYNKSRIIRDADRSKNFCIIPNDILQSTELTPNEKSLLVHLLSMPDDWYYVKTKFYKQTNLGRNAYYTAWKGLEEQGYITTKKIMEGNLLRGYDYTITDLPKTGNTENRTSRKPVNKQRTHTQRTQDTKKENKKDSSSSSSYSNEVKGEKLLDKTDDITTLISNPNLSAEQKNRKSMKMAGELFDEYWGKI